jgi:hypothetical protein
MAQNVTAKARVGHGKALMALAKNNCANIRPAPTAHSPTSQEPHPAPATCVAVLNGRLSSINLIRKGISHIQIQIGIFTVIKAWIIDRPFDQP